MDPRQLTRIDLPNGRVGVTLCPQSRITDIATIFESLPHAGGTLRVISFGDRQRHPITWLWTRQPRLAACLTEAFAYTLIELSDLPDPFNMAQVWALVFSNDRQVVLLQQMSGIEPPMFLPALAPLHQRADASLKSIIEIASECADPTASIAIQAGLFLMNDCLDQSHSCSQSIEGEGRNGDYWHAIMHRREPDYGNAKYWFRQVGRHPVFERLPGIAARIVRERKVAGLERLAAGDWDPFLFVDQCERHARDEESPAGLALREIQGWEMAFLLDQSLANPIDAV
jgi:hypothetical protein